MRAAFVYNEPDLNAAIAGGVQICSREFLGIVRAASDETVTCSISRSRAPLLRLQRLLRMRAYLGFSEAEVERQLRPALGHFRPTHVFLNHTELTRVSSVVGRVSPQAKIVLMSHGNQSGDDLYELAGPGGRRTGGWSRLGAIWKLGLDLETEARHRHGGIDAVVVMSHEEEILERWLGARCTILLPRIVKSDPLAWSPVAGRCGYVGTLDHTPNRLALDSICTVLARSGEPVELRVAGGPASVGRDFAARFPFVTYVGRLDNESLRTEAGSWSVFLNPILWLSRGASMKLGVALAWGLPVLTTKSGARGYEFGDAQVPTCDDNAADLVAELRRLLGNPAALQAAKVASEQAALAAPTEAGLAALLRRRLDALAC